MSGFALNLDLSYYFDDLRKFSCVLVDVATSKIVGDVEKHIKNIFKLDDNICLTSKKFLIPRCENINILKQYEILKVQKCDFFDRQIHNNKSKYSANEENQTALNLIQPEKSIDLSCRPKQRLKISESSFNSSAGSFLLAQSGDSNKNISPSKTHFPSPYTSLGKNRRKKNKHLQIIDVNGSHDILDMSLSRPDDSDYDRFTNDHGANHSKSVVNNEPNTGGLEELEKRSKKKCKKRHNSSYYDLNDVSDTMEGANSHKKKKKKKSSKYELDSENENDATDYSSFANTKEMAKSSLNDITSIECDTIHQENNNFDGSIVTDFCTKRKKHKKSNDRNEMTNNSDHMELSENVDVTNDKSNAMKVDRICKNSDSNTSFSTCNANETIQKNISDLNGEFSNVQKNRTDADCIASTNFKHTNSLESNNKEDPATFVEPTPKVKRVRRHRKRNKQKKGAVSLKMMNAIGPILGMLDDSSSLEKMPVVHQVTTPRSGQHIYFNDNDFDDEMSIPSSPANEVSESQDLSSQAQCSTTQDALKESPAVDVLPTWKQQLLKLASSAKPLVFHRETSERENPVNSKTNGSLSMQTAKSDVPSNADPHKQSSQTQNSENSQSVGLCNKKENANVVENMEHKINSKRSLDDIGSFNVEENKQITDLSHSSVNMVYSNADVSKKFLESLPPMPYDLQHITLSNYPVIDKVVTNDLIFFKMLKINDQKQPDVSKNILAKVVNSSEFPRKISLQIIGGQDEFQDLDQTVENGETFIVELSWTEIIEPRLFFP